ncbi:hypothetical protein CUW_2521 [Turicibacter sanguinis PC909]|uniref:Uncharacterized protein n=1 Tax=Turicibacter sanguinis PC909 TaxID=702450 RepID=A0ABP2I723_9FIRM|nr:hypothetical protein [Turicibacter sanguinis]EFF64560.1 hypothetical protein CUW_2521 [Turicibacter sanguinis PC909]
MKFNMLILSYIGALFCSFLVNWSITDLQYNQINDNLQRSVKNSVLESLIINRQTEKYYIDEDLFKKNFEKIFAENTNQNNTYEFEYMLNEYGATVRVKAETPLSPITLKTTYILEEHE